MALAVLTAFNVKRDDAIGRAQELAKKQASGEVIIHGTDGRIRDAKIYWRDRKSNHG